MRKKLIGLAIVLVVIVIALLPWQIKVFDEVVGLEGELGFRNGTGCPIGTFQVTVSPSMGMLQMTDMRCRPWLYDLIRLFKN